MRVDNDGALQHEHHRVAIRFGSGDLSCADVASRSWPVLDDHRLAEPALQLLADNAGRRNR
jgi:hypothetical protein